MARIGDKTPISREAPELSREEEYRDLEERNLDDGWPYADGTAASDPANRPYGETAANFDSDPNTGFRIDGTDQNGNENRLKDSLRAGLIDRDESDELEARVNDALENIPEVDINSIEVHADGHVVTLEGSVETIGIARRVELGALSVEGVHHVRNKLQLSGVDAHIPNDD